MNYSLKGHCFEDEVLSVLQMFYPNQSYKLTDSDDKSGIYVISRINDDIFTAEVYNKGAKLSDFSCKSDCSDIKEIKRYIKLSVYSALKKIIDIKTPWGILTGIRPAKRAVDMYNEGFCSEEIEKVLKEKYLVSDEKIKLTMSVARAERKILVDNNDRKISLYIGIPFCPTRCLYCSFTSYPLDKYSKRVDEYIKCLEKEMAFLSDKIKDYELESIYVGGGTPTSLNEKQLDGFLKSIKKYFKNPIEFSVEAGRPDTITKDKLKILKEYDVNRISINPQTMNEKTLRLIGREHTVEDFIRAFEMAREQGHKHINTDLILGLPEETSFDAEETMKKITSLNPESITVHTLAVKRASRLKEQLADYTLTQYDEMEKMLNISAEYAKRAGMFPYYMYRQKNMLGNFENVGYCKEGCEGIYNVQIMEEKQTVIAAGAGGSTKIYQSRNNNVERVFNVKSVDDYINRIDEMIQRKAAFFDKYLR